MISKMPNPSTMLNCYMKNKLPIINPNTGVRKENVFNLVSSVLLSNVNHRSNDSAVPKMPSTNSVIIKDAFH